MKLSSGHNMAIKLMNTQQLGLPTDQGSQNSDIDQGRNLQVSPLFNELLAVDGCWWRELHYSLRVDH